MAKTRKHGDCLQELVETINGGNEGYYQAQSIIGGGDALAQMYFDSARTSILKPERKVLKLFHRAKGNRAGCSLTLFDVQSVDYVTETDFWTAYQVNCAEGIYKIHVDKPKTEPCTPENDVEGE